jgi:hypothetical protein
MGTNYYIQTQPTNHCDKCGREDPAENIHIGKSSGGWKFSFHTRFKTFKEWKVFLEANKDQIVDEYDSPISLEDLLEIVEEKQGGIWLGDPRYERAHHELSTYEYLDPEGYRFINAETFC